MVYISSQEKLPNSQAHLRQHQNQDFEIITISPNFENNDAKLQKIF